MVERDRDWRETLLAGAVALGLAVTAVTELLSVFGSLTPFATGLAWALLLPPIGFVVVRGLRGRLRLTAERESIVWGCLLGGLWAMTLVTALICPPNTSDALIYHLTRVENWLQNASVRHYPTPDLRQLYFPPWAEFAIANLKLLAGNDRLVNLVQWLASVGCSLGVSLLVRDLGGSGRAQLYGALWCASVPMLLLQASSCQNDCVEAFWLVCLAHFGLRAVRDCRWRNLALVGLSAGLALLTKGTGYLYAPPFLVMSLRRRLSLSQVGMTAVLILVVNGGFYFRNCQLRGEFLGQTNRWTRETRIHSPEPRLAGWNVVRNLALHLPVNPGSGPERALRAIQRATGVDPDDPRFTFPGQSFRLSGWRRHEDLIGNVLDLPLALGALLLLARRPKPELVGYAVAVVLGFVLFSVALRWQPWGARLQLPIWILFSPIVGLMLERAGRPGRYLLLMHVVWGVLCLFYNETRPWKDDRIWRYQGPAWNIFTRSRTEQYFSSAPPSDAAEAIQAEEQIRAFHPDTLGVLGFHLDYLLWLGGETALPRMKVVYVGVTNESARCPSPFQEPAPSVVLRSWTDTPVDLPSCHIVWQSQHLQLYVRDP